MNEVYYIGPAANATSASTFGLDFGTNDVTGSKTNHATLNPFTNGLNDDTGADLGIDSSTNQWVHVAMTWDQKALLTYVNGLPKDHGQRNDCYPGTQDHPVAPVHWVQPDQQ